MVFTIYTVHAVTDPKLWIPYCFGPWVYIFQILPTFTFSRLTMAVQEYFIQKGHGFTQATTPILAASPAMGIWLVAVAAFWST